MKKWGPAPRRADASTRLRVDLTKDRWRRA